MPDDPIGREIAQMRKDSAEDFNQLRGDLKDGLNNIRTGLAGMVTRDVHDLALSRVTDRLSIVERDLDRLVNAIEAERKTTVERRAADRRVINGAVLAAALGIEMQVLSSTGIAP